MPLCNDCGEALNFRGICSACGWSATAKKPIVAPKSVIASKPAPIAAKPGTPKPPAPPTKQLAPPMKPGATKPKTTNDDELMEMALSSMNKPSGTAKPVKKSPGKKGEEDFWEEGT